MFQNFRVRVRARARALCARARARARARVFWNYDPVGRSILIYHFFKVRQTPKQLRLLNN